MAKMLMREIDDQDKVLLAQLTLHPGWQVVEKMFADFCATSTAAVIQLDPAKEPDQYEARLKALQMQARVANDICSSLLRSIKVLVNDAVAKSQDEGQTTEDLIREVVNRVRPTAQ